MCFGRNKCQKNPEDCRCQYPSENNCCGGFALNAVLVDMGKHSTPVEVYTLIQVYQRVNILLTESDPIAKGYLNAKILTGTYLSLPSGICAAFNYYSTRKRINVCYTSTFKRSFSALIGNETSRIGALDIGISDLGEKRLGTDWSYVIVLVNNSHWVAVKKITEKKETEEKTSFTCYDPDSGRVIMGDSMENALKNSGYREADVSGLYICIS